MKVLLQRVSDAEVSAGGQSVGRIGHGLLAFVCAERGDTQDQVAFFAKKVAKLRVFPDETGKTNLSVQDVGGAVLAISQFTLAADWRKGNRPGFSKAEAPDKAEPMYQLFCDALREVGINVETGVFAANMQVSLTNDGPFTIIMDSRD